MKTLTLVLVFLVASLAAATDSGAWTWSGTFSTGESQSKELLPVQMAELMPFGKMFRLFSQDKELLIEELTLCESGHHWSVGKGECNDFDGDTCTDKHWSATFSLIFEGPKHVPDSWNVHKVASSVPCPGAADATCDAFVGSADSSWGWFVGVDDDIVYRAANWQAEGAEKICMDAATEWSKKCVILTLTSFSDKPVAKSEFKPPC